MKKQIWPEPGLMLEADVWIWLPSAVANPLERASVDVEVGQDGNIPLVILRLTVGIWWRVSSGFYMTTMCQASSSTGVLKHPIKIVGLDA